MVTNAGYTGLQNHEVLTKRKQYGHNTLLMEEDKVFFHVVKEVVLEPMFIMLVVCCSIYFILDQQEEGFIMLASIFIVSGISFFQEYRSRNAIKALKKISSSKATVIREGETLKIPSDEIVVDDLLMLEEGEIVHADGEVISSNDLSINESILTGEAFVVYKSHNNAKDVFKGTLVTSGSAAIRVTKVGMQTRFGEIGLSLKSIKPSDTPLQLQIRSFVRSMAWFGAIAFLFVFIYNFYKSESITYGLLQGLTLAMSVLPEEIPVAFSAFMALGAFRLLKQKVIVKQPTHVETLGSATVICVDKTGTLTENRMEINYVYDAHAHKSYSVSVLDKVPHQLLEYAMWASETDPFDPMEKAIHELYEKITTIDKRKDFKQVHEYPLSGIPPLMTHIFTNNKGEIIVACKGAPEAIVNNSRLSAETISKISVVAKEFAQQGYRVLGIGKADFAEQNFPEKQDSIVFDFLGMIAFYDPPKARINETINIFHRAGIKVKMITGDHAETAKAIAKQVNITPYETCMTGNEVMACSEKELGNKIKIINVFARMFPEAKLKVVEALKAGGEIVAMTGDGVNDAPALKAAEIGIAMGKKGNEVAKGAASLIITDDDLFHMTEAVALGRKIYDNLQKAIQYIISIHIPILLIVMMPLILAWKYSSIFSPVHVIFLELIMGPTCSIIYENEKMEEGTMSRPPRKISNTFLSFRQLMLSIVQGVIIAAGCLFMGYYFMQQSDEATVRTVIFITLLFSNIFLTLVNRSFYYSILVTVRYRNVLMWLIIACSILLILASLNIPGVMKLFAMTLINMQTIFLCIAVALISTWWIEIYKWKKRMK